MRAPNAPRRWLTVVFFGVSVLALCGPSLATAAPIRANVTYFACIELTGDAQTQRDLKLREGPVRQERASGRLAAGHRRCGRSGGTRRAAGFLGWGNRSGGVLRRGGPNRPAPGRGPGGRDGCHRCGWPTGLQGPIGATGPTGGSRCDRCGWSGRSDGSGWSDSWCDRRQTGAAGADGATGLQGPVGATGPTGATGAVGATGAAGATGAHGATGLQGPGALPERPERQEQRVQRVRPGQQARRAKFDVRQPERERGLGQQLPELRKRGSGNACLSLISEFISSPNALVFGPLPSDATISHLLAVTTNSDANQQSRCSTTACRQRSRATPAARSTIAATTLTPS